MSTLWILLAVSVSISTSSFIDLKTFADVANLESELGQDSISIYIKSILNSQPNSDQAQNPDTISLPIVSCTNSLKIWVYGDEFGSTQASFSLDNLTNCNQITWYLSDASINQFSMSVSHVGSISISLSSSTINYLSIGPQTGIGSISRNLKISASSSSIFEVHIINIYEIGNQLQHDDAIEITARTKSQISEVSCQGAPMMSIFGNIMLTADENARLDQIHFYSLFVINGSVEVKNFGTSPTKVLLTSFSDLFWRFRGNIKLNSTQTGNTFALSRVSVMEPETSFVFNDHFDFLVNEHVVSNMDGFCGSMGVLKDGICFCLDDLTTSLSNCTEPNPSVDFYLPSILFNQTHSNCSYISFPISSPYDSAEIVSSTVTREMDGEFEVWYVIDNDGDVVAKSRATIPLKKTVSLPPSGFVWYDPVSSQFSPHQTLNFEIELGTGSYPCDEISSSSTSLSTSSHTNDFTTKITTLFPTTNGANPSSVSPTTTTTTSSKIKRTSSTSSSSSSSSIITTTGLTTNIESTTLQTTSNFSTTLLLNEDTSSNTFLIAFVTVAIIFVLFISFCGFWIYFRKRRHRVNLSKASDDILLLDEVSNQHVKVMKSDILQSDDNQNDGLLLNQHVLEHVTSNYGNFSLHFLCQKDYPIDVVAALISKINSDGGGENGSQICQTLDEHGFTPLHHAVANNRLDIIHCLIMNIGKNCIDSRDGQGRTPLMVAAGLDLVDCMTILMDYGADAQAVSYRGRTILHMAAMCGCENAVRSILSRENLAELSTIQDENGNSPSHLAALEHNLKIVEIIFKHFIFKTSQLERLKLATNSNFHRVSDILLPNLQNDVSASLWNLVAQ